MQSRPPLRVFFPRLEAPEHISLLQEWVGTACEVLTGPQPENYELLVEGRPTEAVLDVKSLRAVIVPYAGVPAVTTEAIRARPHLSLYNIHHNAGDTAEMTIALLMAAGKQIVTMDRSLRQNDWTPGYLDSTAFSFEGRTALVLGYGEIGRRVARVLKALGLTVLATRRSAIGVASEDGVEIHAHSDLYTLLPQTQVLIVTAPLTAETEGLISKRELELLPLGAILVNTARGPIIDEEALYNALKSGHLHSAGLDVWYRYPQAESDVAANSPDARPTDNTPPSKFPFGELDNVVMTPHIGGNSLDTEPRRMRAVADVLIEIANGEEPYSRVNLERGY